ncbi:MAG: hypothetical protein M3285_10745 [Actinomycetota bacterium]|nr:hypothetical protein [Actinomycetota bacterium]
MTALLAASILLIAGSAVALVMGWLNANEGYMYVSIGATAAAFAALVVAYFRSSKVPAAATQTPVGSDDQPEEADAASTTAVVAEDQSDPNATKVIPPAPPGPQTELKGDSTDEGTLAGDAEVVGVPSTKKFHRPECRFAGAKDTEKMTRADADEKGFAPCGTCKP